MKRALLSLSCLLALSACKHAAPEPDFRPGRDIPPGAIVHVTLQDRKNPRRISTYVVDARAGQVLMRLDGARALELQRPAAPPPRTPSFVPPAPMKDERQGGGTGSQTTSTFALSSSVTVQADCPPPSDEREEDGCVDANAIDPKIETTGNPDPQNENPKFRRGPPGFVIKLAQGLFEAAKLSGLPVQPQQLQRR
jgi:hypothetical protein